MSTLDAGVKKEIDAELDKVLLDLRRLQALDMDATVKLMVRMMTRMVRQLKLTIAKSR